MNRRNFIKAMGAASVGFSLSGCLPSAAKEASRKPNFVVIFADDLGYGDVGCFGHPTTATPNIDRMAREGQKWTNFYAASSVCTPSRSGLLTGRYPVRTGTEGHVFFEWSGDGLSPEEITVAEALKREGYATSCVGKWHLGHLPEFLPKSQGFDEYFGIPYSNDMRVDPGMKVADDIRFREGMTLEKMRDPANKKYGWAPLIEGDEVVEYPCDQRTLTRRYTQRCVDFIRANREGPFFLYMAHSFPHVPLFASEEFRDTSRRGLYGDVVQELDASVGAILRTLGELGIERDTLVVFTSDNGPWLTMDEQGGCAGLLRGGKGQTWEGGMREPTVFWQPGRIKAGSVVRDIGSTLDLYRTFCGLSGAGMPVDRAMDSYDLAPALFGTGASGRKSFIYYRGGEIYAVREGQWKAHFITQGSYGRGEKKTVHEKPLLFHLGHDPGEKYNVSDEHPEVLERLVKLAAEHRSGVVPGASRFEKRLER